MIKFLMCALLLLPAVSLADDVPQLVGRSCSQACWAGIDRVSPNVKQQPDLLAYAQKVCARAVQEATKGYSPATSGCDRIGSLFFTSIMASCKSETTRQDLRDVCAKWALNGEDDYVGSCKKRR